MSSKNKPHAVIFVVAIGITIIALGLLLLSGWYLWWNNPNLIRTTFRAFEDEDNELTEKNQLKMILKTTATPGTGIKPLSSAEERNLKTWLQENQKQ